MPDHGTFATLIWQIADPLRGPCRPPQYEFLRTAKAMQLTADDFTALIADLKRRRSRETGRTSAE